MDQNAGVTIFVFVSLILGMVAYKYRELEWILTAFIGGIAVMFALGISALCVLGLVNYIKKKLR